ncbi:DUF4012 domain-containing protein [Pseudarthrobacter sp. BIM B-2242]|uniref:DUF4012 domain-containing protein n=1 Tax=Pseudarthrobacter sp. BIM B-2242 TaxID=2772401 RepID=UPI00168B813E|nr:DUF4012 domain-containing protein [Pseudarthrobacter sp. BIM B-2242]QOD02643.1 DUF4012 domain-containing protein [Pseudarthrobacter sp. BIM B-2242]
MNENQGTPAIAVPSTSQLSKSGRKVRRRLLVSLLGSLAAIVLIAVAGAAWLGGKASAINSELTSVTGLIPSLKEEIASGNSDAATVTVESVRAHAATAKQAADDPLWTLASTLPGVGSNFSAVAEVARSADDVANLGLAPLVEVYGSLDWGTLLPSASGTDLEPLRAASPSISAAAHAVRLSADRLRQIDTTKLMPHVAEPLTRARDQLQDITGTLDAAANASSLAPGMLGAQSPRSYLLMIQNNAETRASGGIPGALAVLNFDEGRLTLGAQSSAADIGVMSPIVPTDPEQQQIYSQRVGKFMQDVNLTPDFPTAASTAQAMWERKTGQRVDGVISIDPVALSYILDATGPVKITHPELVKLASLGLPTELTGKNVVQTLLSDVYAKIEQPVLQDVYFAGVAQEIFAALSDGRGNAKGMIEGLTRGTGEGRVLVWSGLPSEQSVIAKYALSGSVAGPSVAPAQFGVYFNDGTGAKMDFYIKRTVQLIQECTSDDYSQITVRIASTNTAPSNAATSLPSYVTGGGAFGIAPGTVQTNVTAYGPVQANLAGAKQDGKVTSVSSHRHAGRPVGTTTVTLAPGESSTVDMKFNKIVQHTRPALRVTPTVQDIGDVLLETESATCDPVP